MSKFVTPKNNINNQTFDSVASYSSLRTHTKQKDSPIDEKEYLMEQKLQSTTSILEDNEKLKEIQNVIKNIFIINILMFINSILFKLISKQIDGLLITFMTISITSFVFNVFLVLSIKCFCTNDPNNTKLFRAESILVILLVFGSFGLQIVEFIIDLLNLRRLTIIRIISYLILFFSTTLLFMKSFKIFNLLCDCFLIFINKKKEYSFLFDDKITESKGKFIYNNHGKNRRYITSDNDKNIIPPMYQNFHSSLNRNIKDGKFNHKID